jgi:predicted RNase H-like HicB family nuclease
MKLKECEFLVRWSKEDEEWVATCNKFPYLSWLGNSAREALAGMMSQTLETINDMKRAEKRIE